MKHDPRFYWFEKEKCAHPRLTARTQTCTCTCTRTQTQSQTQTCIGTRTRTHRWQINTGCWDTLPISEEADMVMCGSWKNHCTHGGNNANPLRRGHASVGSECDSRCDSCAIPDRAMKGIISVPGQSLWWAEGLVWMLCSTGSQLCSRGPPACFPSLPALHTRPPLMALLIRWAEHSWFSHSRA